MPDEQVYPRPVVSGPSPDDVAGHAFPSARRGLDPEAVRRYLGEVATSLRESQRREEELRRRLQDAERQPQQVEVPLDEATLTAALGVETGRVLQAAHEAARDIVAKAERRANALLADAESALAERTRHAEHEANEMIGRARNEATVFLETTREQARMMIDEARDARRRILTDLTERRRALHFQIEQLRAGKDSLTEVLNGISGSIVASIDAVRARLEGAEDQARVAASDARREASAPEPDDLTIDELADIAPPELDVELTVSLPEPPVFSASEPPEAAPAAPEPVLARATATEPEPPAATVEQPETIASTPGVDEEAAADGEPPRGIDELFARIRASRQQEVADARAAMEAAERAAVPFVSAPEIAPVAAPTVEDAPEPAASEAPAPSTRGRRSTATSEPDKPSTSQAAVVSAPRSAVLQTDIEGDEFQLLVRRDQLLGPSIAELGRALKRTLRLEQNDLLDAMRNLKRAEEAASHLPDEAMVLRVAGSAMRGLEAAWLAGEAFVGDLLGGASAALLQDAGDRDEELGEISRLLAMEIVDPIRRGLEARLARANGEEGAAGNAVGAAFRDWKGSKVEGLAGDYASRAFARSTVQASRRGGTAITWLVDDGDQRCPDCDDNALAGAVEAGTEFPTGHLHPPIHPGCRCIVVPVQR